MDLNTLTSFADADMAAGSNGILEHLRSLGQRFVEPLGPDQEELSLSGQSKALAAAVDSIYRYCKTQRFLPNVAFLCEGIECMLDLIVQTGVVTLAYNTFRRFRQSMDGIVAIPLDCEIE